MDDNLNIEVILKYKVENDTYTSRLTGQHITRCSVIEGRSERYGHVEVEIRKDIFDKNIEGVWDENNPKPIFTLGKTLVSVSGFDEVNDYILTSVVYEDYVIKITAYHPGHKINNVDLSDLLDGLFTFEGNTTAKLAYSWYMGEVLKSYTSEPVTVWAKFKSVLDNNESLYLPSDAFRALGLYGGGESIYLQGTYPGDVYKARITPPSPPMEIYNRDLIRSLLKTTGDLSWFSSGVGFKGYSMPWSKYTTDEGETYSIPSTNKFLYVYRKDDYEVIFHLSTTEQRETEGGAITTSVEIEWIEGSADDLVRFILDMTIGDDSYPQIFSEPTRLISNDTTVKDTYTEEEILELRNATLIPMDAYYDKRGYPIGLAHYNKRYTSRLRIRPQGLCTDWLEIIGIYTNRSFFFGNDGFYMMGDKGITDPNVIILNKISKDGTTITKVEESYDVISKVILASDIQKVPSADIQYVDKHAQTPEIEQYTSDNLVISQGVQSENYKFTTRNEEYTASGKERDLEFNIVDMDQVEYRNRTVNLCALHGLIRKSGYGYNISYTLFETSNIIPTVFPPKGMYFTSLEDLIATGTHPAGSTAIVDTGFKITHYKRVKNAWEAYTPTLPERKKYEPKDIVGAVSDEINGVTILRSPLGYIIREYPTGLTNVSWGNNPTTNLASTTKSLMDGYSTTQPIGSGDTQISNKTSSRIVIGNMSASDVAQVGLENTLYTGLIMEKESESNTYQLVGFDRGVEQAKFNTEGKIEAGAGTVLLDANGFSMEGDGIYISNDGIHLKEYNETTEEWTDSVILDKNGLVMEGDGVYLTKYGLIFEDEDGNVIFIDKNGLVSEDKSGNTHLMITGKGITLEDGTLIIDKDGMELRKFDNATQKWVENVILNSDGLSIKDGSLRIDHEGLHMDGEGISLSGSGLVFEDNNHGKVTLNKNGMTLIGTDNKTQLIANGKGIVVGDDEVVIDKNGFAMNGDGVYLNGDGLKLGANDVILNKEGIIIGEDFVILNSNGLYMKEGGVELSKSGLTLEDSTTGKVVLDAAGMKLYGSDTELQLKINGEGIADGGGNLLFNKDGLTVKDVATGNNVFNVAKDSLAIRMRQDELDSMSLDIQGAIKITDSQIDGGGVTLNNKGLILSNDDGTVVISNVSDEKGLIATDASDNIQVALTGNGLILPSTVTNESMLLNREGLTFQKGADKQLNTSLIQMNAEKLIASKYMKIDNVSDYYEQVTLDGDGLHIRNNAVVINRNGFSCNDGKVVLNDMGLTANGVTIDSTGLSFTRGGVKLNGSGLTVTDKLTIDANGLSMTGDGVFITENGIQLKEKVGSNWVNNVILDKKGLSLPSGVTNQSMQLNRNGITFQKGADNTEDTSLIQMDAEKLIFSKYMELQSGNKFYEQVKLDGDGLSVRDGAVKLDMRGLTFDQGGIIVNEDGLSAKGIRISGDGLSIYDEVDRKIASLSNGGMTFSDVYDEGDSIIYKDVITMDSRGLTTTNVTIDLDGLTVSQGGVNISKSGIDTLTDNTGVKLDQNGLTFYSEQATDNSTLKFKGPNDIIMGEIYSEFKEIPIPDVKATNTAGTINKETYVTTIDGLASDGSDSTLILRSTAGELIGDTPQTSPMMSNAGKSIYLTYGDTITLADNSNGVSSITRPSGVYAGFDSSKFPLGICDTVDESKLKVTVKITQPCTSTNWEFIRYTSVTVNIGSLSWSKSLNDKKPTDSSLILTLDSAALKGAVVGGAVSASLGYRSTMPDFMWALYEHCRPSIKVTKVELSGGIIIKQGAVLPSRYSDKKYKNAYWCGSFVNLSHKYINTVKNQTTLPVSFEVYRGTTRVTGSIDLPKKNADSTGGTVSINPYNHAGMNITGSYNARYKLPIDSTYTGAKTLMKIGAEYISPTPGGGHIYLRPDGTYLRGNTEISAGSLAKMTLSSGGGDGWGGEGGIYFGESKVSFDKTDIDGKPKFSTDYIEKVRSSLSSITASNLRTGSGYVKNTWYPNNTDSVEFITLTRTDHQYNEVLISSSSTGSLSYKVGEQTDSHNGDGSSTVAFILPKGWYFSVVYSGTYRAIRIKLGA